MGKRTKISKLVIKDYEKLVKEVSELNGIIYHHKSVHEVYQKHMGKRREKGERNFILGSRLYYRSPYDGKLISGNSYTVDIKNFQVKTFNINRKAINYFVALSYEAFEKFLRSITARIIINNKTKAIVVNERLGFSSYRSCLLYLQTQYRNNSDIVSLLRKLSPELDTSFKKEKNLRNFLNFYRVYSKCRNHIIHSNDIIDIATLRKPEIIDEKFANRYFGVKKLKDTKCIIDTVDCYNDALTTAVSFAYLIICSFDSTFIK